MRITRINSWKRLFPKQFEEYAVVIHLRLSKAEYKQYNEGKLSLLDGLYEANKS